MRSGFGPVASSRGDGPLQYRFRWVPGGAALAVMVCGGIVLGGWTLNVEVLSSVVPGWVTMKANAALCFLLGGASLWLSRVDGATMSARFWARTFASVVALIGAMTFAEYVARGDLGIDEVLVREVLTSDDPTPPGRMAPATALSFVCLGIAVLGLDWRTSQGHRPAQALALAPFSLSVLAFAGHVYEAGAFHFFPGATGMALHTSISFMVFALGVLYARPGSGSLNVLAGEGFGSVMARRLLPAALALPILFGWLGNRGLSASSDDRELGLALQAAANIFVFAILTWATAVWLNRMEARSRDAEKDSESVRADLVALKVAGETIAQLNLGLGEALRAKEALLKEVHHRVKNNLSLIISLMRLEAGRRRNPETRAVLTEMQGRIRSVSLLNEALYRAASYARVNLADYIGEIANHLIRAQTSSATPVRLVLDLRPVEVETGQAIPCGLIVNELVTNSLKHGLVGGRSGEIRISLEQRPNCVVRLQVSDTGPGLPADFEARRGRSLGLQLVADLAAQLHGAFEAGPDASFSVTFPGAASPVGDGPVSAPRPA